MIGKTGVARGFDSKRKALAGSLIIHEGCYHKVKYLSRTVLGILGVGRAMAAGGVESKPRDLRDDRGYRVMARR